jgi:ribosome-associated toxin RatA of RatAB toxin-antitoxin module
MIAQLTFDFYGFKNSLTTKNTLKQNQSINMSFQNGPFKSFDAVWIFEVISSQSSQLDFKMDYKLNNTLLEFAFKKNLNSVSDIIVDAFKEKL